LLTLAGERDGLRVRLEPDTTEKGPALRTVGEPQHPRHDVNGSAHALDGRGGADAAP